MPFTHTSTFRVRYYECDAYGHLNNANYLRYMQEAAFNASAAAGYGLEHYAGMQRIWLIRESELEFLRPLGYNQEAAVATQVADFRRVTSRRSYVFTRTGDPQEAGPVATGWSDWVFMDTRLQRPARIPQALIDAFYPEGNPPDGMGDPFPSLPPAPPGAFVQRRRVAWQEIDPVGHVNNANYAVYASDCGFAATEHFGWPWERLAQMGIGIYLRRLRVQYLQPALFGDELQISAWIYNARRSTAQRCYTITRVSDGALLAQVDTLSVWVSLQSGQPVRIPPQMRADFAPNIAV
ncbi:MAG: acyl-CoA thioesterase [Chloroflexota bacterium]